MNNYSSNVTHMFPFLVSYFPQSNESGNIIIQIHGGGFITGSSNEQQMFTRKWSSITGLTIFALDYRLAPEYPYPHSLEDVWQGYYWIITHSHILLKKPINKIILTGDSAGACLAFALTIKATQANLRIPDLMILGYPVLNLDPKHFYPSLLLGVDNVLVKAAYLKLCNKCYMGSYYEENDPFLSPMSVSDIDLLKFPEVHFLAAGRDSLRDHSYAMHHRLL